MSSPNEKRRNETRMYNKFTLKTLDEKYPNVRLNQILMQKLYIGYNYKSV